MKKNNDGRFCDNCNKTVIDFTTTSTDDLNKLTAPAEEEDLCGSFYAYQLDKPFNNWKDSLVSLNKKYLVRRNNSGMFRKTALYLLTILLFCTGCFKRMSGKVCVKQQSNPESTKQASKR